MAWVVDWTEPSPEKRYNPNRSAFWRVARAFARDAVLDGDDRAHWSCHVAWTNLHKIAPVGGGNPSVGAREKQRQFCIDLLNLEREMLAPSCVLVLTSPSWSVSFFPSVPKVPRSGRFVHAVGRQEGTAFLFADHPQTRPEEAFIDELLVAYRELSRS